MHRLRAWALVAGIALVAVIGLVVAFNMSGSGTDAPTAFAGVPTPKPGTDGNFAGIYDVQVHPADKAVGLFHCIIRLDDDAAVGDNDLKASAQCYSDTDVSGGSPLKSGANVNPGPPPPPPYGSGDPTKLNGSYDPGTDTITLRGCFDNLGGTLGPNVVASVTIPTAKASLAGGILSGTVSVNGQESNAECAAKLSNGSPEPPGQPTTLSVNLQRITAVPVATTLGAAVDATQTKIPVIDTTGFNAGWLVLVGPGLELMVIGGIDVTGPGCAPVPAPCFTGVTRHVNGTNAGLGHANGAGVAMISRLGRLQGNLDFDGDGCLDADELAKPGSTGNCGDDPYNPHDSDTSIAGPFSASATSIPADWDKVNNVLIPGSYFHCIGNLVQTGLNIDINRQCYSDSPALAGLGGSPLKTDTNGLSGAPPPPPYSDLVPTKATGTITGKIATATGCVANVGGATGPNTITTSTWDINTGQGTVDIWFKQENDNCDASPPTPKGPPSIDNAVLEIAEQDAAWDSDNDGCTDAQELGKPRPKGCGDDPYNRFDSDSDLNSAFDIQVTAVRADVCKAGAPAGVPPVGCDAPAIDGDVATGSYFHCKADIQHTNPGTTNNLAARVLCYTDNDVTTVNCQDAGAGTAATCASNLTCAPFGTTNATRCGNGLPDVPPPSNDPDAGGPGGTAYADVDATQTVLTGQLDKINNEIELEGCFSGVENPTQGPNIYARTVINSDTGQGTVDIFLNRADCSVPVGDPPNPAYNDRPIRIVEQATKNSVTPTNQRDSDLDGCSDKQELRDTQASGGRRDPYNRWDLLSVFTGSPPTRNKAVDTADISALVARFGATDTGPGTFDRNSNPTIAPVAPITPSGVRANYHPAFDREGSLVGANPWNLKPANGNIGTGEISAVVAQFGHQCNT